MKAEHHNNNSMCSDVWPCAEGKTLTMEFEGQMAVDVVLFVLVVAFSLLSVAYIGMLWSLR